METKSKKWLSLYSFDRIIPFVTLLSQSEEVCDLSIEGINIENKTYDIKKKNNSLEIKCSDGRNMFIGYAGYPNKEKEEKIYYLMISNTFLDKEMVFRTNKINSLDEDTIKKGLVNYGEFFLTSENSSKKIFFSDDEFISKIKIGDDVIDISKRKTIDDSSDIKTASFFRDMLLDESIRDSMYGENELSVLYKIFREESLKAVEEVNDEKLLVLESFVKKLSLKQKEYLKSLIK